MITKRFNVDYSHAETGDETTHGWMTLTQVQTLLSKAKEGDDVVIHCLGPQDSGI